MAVLEIWLNDRDRLSIDPLSILKDELVGGSDLFIDVEVEDYRHYLETGVRYAPLTITFSIPGLFNFLSDSKAIRRLGLDNFIGIVCEMNLEFSVHGPWKVTIHDAYYQDRINQFVGYDCIEQLAKVMVDASEIIQSKLDELVDIYYASLETDDQ